MCVCVCACACVRVCVCGESCMHHHIGGKPNCVMHTTLYISEKFTMRKSVLVESAKCLPRETCVYTVYTRMHMLHCRHTHLCPCSHCLLSPPPPLLTQPPTVTARLLVKLIHRPELPWKHTATLTSSWYSRRQQVTSYTYVHVFLNVYTYLYVHQLMHQLSYMCT